jgi:uncharacterized damage-inducible protein DinB/cytochrome c553
MRKRSVALFLSLVVPALPALAQAPAPNPLDADNPGSAALRQFYTIAKRNILRGAEKMPEADYAFRPTPEVRSFAELLAHIAEGQYLFCSSLKGEPNPVSARGELEKSKTTKADLLPVLQASFDYCDPVLASLTDAQLGDKVQFFGRERTKSVPATLTVAHTWEHYGNMVTYLRLKGLVPPSSEQAPPPPPAAQEKPAEQAPPAKPKPPDVPPAKKPTQLDPPPRKPPASPGDTAKGQSVYTRACAKCHAADGSGVAAIAKAMKVEMKPLGGADVQKKTDEQLKKDITEGTGKMVKVAGLSADDVTNVIAYLRTLKK